MKAERMILGLFVCSLLLLPGCGKSPRETGAEIKKNIEAALQERDLDTVTKELERLVEYMQSHNISEIEVFQAAWPNDSLSSWLDDIKSKAEELGKQDEGS